MSREVFTNCNGLAVNCVLYQESGLINLWGAGLYYDGVDCWVVNSSGVITGTSSCVPSPTPTPTPTVTPTPTPPAVYSGDVWFGTSPSSGFDQACDRSNPGQYLYWSGALLFYPGLVLYQDSGLLTTFANTPGYTYCSSDGSGGGFDEYTLSGATLGSWTGTTC